MSEPLWTAREALAATGGLLTDSKDWVAEGVSIDTRTLKPGDLFFAIRGEARDGHDFMRAALEKAVARANEAVSRAESIRTFEVLPTDFTVANGLLTPSLKVRRAEAEKRFAAEIDALYTRTPLVPSTTASPSQD